MTHPATTILRRAIRAAHTGLGALRRALARQSQAYITRHGGVLRGALHALATILDWIALYWALTGHHEQALTATLISIALKAVGRDLTCRILHQVRRAVTTIRSCWRHAADTESVCRPWPPAHPGGHCAVPATTSSLCPTGVMVSARPARSRHGRSAILTSM
ncbi:hypothetical protein [Nocardia sp. CA-119907]|uniref:hypothetical protein n=1 Tax=Nocardia sp. CA-119907 TaxID=3239973 RepID=UPI003D95D3B4